MNCTHSDHDTAHLTPADTPAHCADCGGSGEIPVEGGYLECACGLARDRRADARAKAALLVWRAMTRGRALKEAA